MADADWERLKRIAFGRDATAEERSSAEESLRQRESQNFAVASVTSIELSSEPNSELNVESLHSDEADTVEAESDSVPRPVQADMGEQSAEQPLWRRSIRIGWLVPIALGAFLLGALAAGQREPAAVTVSPTPTEASGNVREWIAGDPDSADGVTVPVIPAQPAPEARPGNVDVADALFDQPATARDSYPINGMLDQLGVDQSSVRLLLDDDNGHMLWAVKQGIAGFCLASYDVWAAMGHSNCATIEEFTASGVSVVSPGFSAWWGGAGLEMWGSR